MENGLFTQEERQRISDAIGEAEEKTSGEIYAVFSYESSGYFFSACFIWTLIVFFASVLLAFFLHYTWRDIALHYFGLGMLLIYAVGLLYLYFIPSLCRFLTPWAVKKHCCHDNAMRQFLAHKVDLTKGRTGILLFVSYAEHYVEVIADRGINSVVEQKTWDDLVTILVSHAKAGKMASGYIKAIDDAGVLLAQFFPPAAVKENELPNRLVEI